jgi:hypothetical protein
MNYYGAFWAWAIGQYQGSVQIDLDPEQSYLVTGFLTQTETEGYAHVYIQEVCTMSGGQQMCGVRDVTRDFQLNIVEVLSGASSVTIGFRTGSGGRHQMEGVIYQL